MELKEFVGSVISEIVDGVISAQKTLAGRGAIIVPPKVSAGTATMYTNHNSSKEHAYVDLIEFKVSIGEVSKSGGKVGLGVLFGAVGVKGDIDKGTEDKSLTEVKFSIPVRYPIQEVK